MTVTVKGNAPIVVPPSVRRKAGIRSGDKIKFETNSSGVITIEKEVKYARDEYTPEQRKIIDARLDEAMKEYQRGEFIEFSSVDEMAAYLKKKRAAKRTNKTKK
jgi:bifunctional DNA-binding transcriptional regulator/antitoxin component of YhaV-PrlF toxin-antitoxin module